MSVQRRSGRTGEAGSALLLTAVLVPALLGFAGLAVDVLNGYAVRGMLQRAVDDAALSARRWSAQVADSPAVSPVTVWQGAAQEALRVVHAELESQGIARASTAAATLTGGDLTVRASARIPTFFAGLFGIGQWTLLARAEATLWIPAAIRGAAPSGFLPPLPGQTQGAPGRGGGLGRAASSLESIGPEGTPSSLPSSPDSPDLPGAGGPCNCDAIAAGDPQSARAALERMGVTPADPGPFRGDQTAEMGLREMQSGPTESSPAESGPAESGAGESDSSRDSF